MKRIASNGLDYAVIFLSQHGRFGRGCQLEVLSIWRQRSIDTSHGSVRTETVGVCRSMKFNLLLSLPLAAVVLLLAAPAEWP
jgi:hypothetical protein